MSTIAVPEPGIRRIARGALLLGALINAGFLFTPVADAAESDAAENRRNESAESESAEQMANESGMIGDIRTVIAGEAALSQGDARRIYDRP
jgi:hypothetical protein